MAASPNMPELAPRRSSTGDVNGDVTMSGNRDKQ